MDRIAAQPERTWCLSEVDIFADLSEAEMDQMAEAAPMRSYQAGTLVLLAEQGLISPGRGRITILDRPGLLDVAGD